MKRYKNVNAKMIAVIFSMEKMLSVDCIKYIPTIVEMAIVYTKDVIDNAHLFLTPIQPAISKTDINAKNPEARKRYGEIADFMHLGGSSDEEKTALLIKFLRDMNKALNIPLCIKNYGSDSLPCEKGFVPEELFLARLHDIAVNAVADACTGSNPRQPSVEEMEKLLLCCYYDTEVDF
jgi:hypothetical protein